MGFMVGFTFIIWLLVAVVAFGSRPAKTGADTAENSSKRSSNDES
jgi:hypothetical protein